MKFNSDPEWLKKQAALGGQLLCFCRWPSVRSRRSRTKIPTGRPVRPGQAFVNLLNLVPDVSISSHGSSSRKNWMWISASELIEIENDDEHYTPTSWADSKLRSPTFSTCTGRKALRPFRAGARTRQTVPRGCLALCGPLTACKGTVVGRA